MSWGKSQFEKCLGKRLEVPDILLPDVRDQPSRLLAIISGFSFPSHQVGFGKRGLFRKVHFLEILENLEILEILENSQTVENKGESSHFLETLENLEILEILEIPPVKRPLS